MTTLCVWAVRKTKQAFINESIRYYTSKITNLYAAFQYHEFDIKKCPKDIDEIKKKELLSFKTKVSSSDCLILLDEKGESKNSIQFSAFLDRQLGQHSYKRVIFLIGGPYGFNKEAYSFAQHKLSLSMMTVSHEIVRPLLLEQIFRGLSIEKRLPYHHV